MAVEGDKPGKTDEPDYKKWGIVIGTISGIFAILAALNTLTGFNPLKDLSAKAGQSSASATLTSAPRLAGTTSEEPEPTHRSVPTTEETTETTPTTESTRPSRPEFRVRSSQWDGPCRNSACSMSAV